MCKYCAFARKNTDILETIMSEEASGLFGDVLFSVYLDRGGKIEFCVGPANGGDEVVGNTKVNFCPMCGEKL